MKELDVGNSDFKSVIVNDNYYIDKSLLIKEIIKSQMQVLLIPRPRRFGKTMNLLMLKYFFEKDKPENKKLFINLQIWRTEKEILEKQGKYPVIYLSFKDVKANSWEVVYDYLIHEIVNVYSRYDFLIDSEFLKDHEKHAYIKILKKKANTADYGNSLKQLSEYLYRYYKEKVVILIDEYDTPIQSGYKKFYEEIISFMRNLLSGAFKDNLYLYKGVITGILRVSKESIFSGLNNLGIYTILEQEFADKFGFTEEEVKQILNDLEIPTPYEQIQKWYNGYMFGNLKDIYNPWSILNYVIGYKNGFKPFWVNTSTDTLLKEGIKHKDAIGSRELILKLISGDVISKDIHENFVFPDLKTKEELIWTLLLFSGYLTIGNKLGIIKYELRIPNYEIKFVFQNIILDWLEQEVKIIKSLLEDTTHYLVTGELDKFAKGFQKIISDTFSYYDTYYEPEKVYHSYVLGLLAILSDDYIIRSNRESGEGRYDILMIPYNKTKNGIVIEIKQIEKKKRESQKRLKERIQKELKSALEQIERNRYYQELVEHKIENIIKVPIVFLGKVPYLQNDASFSY